MKRNDVISAAVMLFLLLGTLVYPRIQLRGFHNRACNAIYEFTAQVESYKTTHNQQMKTLGIHTVPEDDPHFWLNLIWGALWMQNFNLSLNGQEHLLDPFIYAHPCFYINTVFDAYTLDAFGVLTISSIELSMPIYLGTSLVNLHRGVAHLLHSSFPVGGESTNTVIAGHRDANRVFRDIRQLEIGDEIQITNFRNDMTYVVVETKIIEPHQIDALKIQYGRDLVTLITQYGRRGNRRYLIIAERVCDTDEYKNW